MRHERAAPQPQPSLSLSHSLLAPSLSNQSPPNTLADILSQCSVSVSMAGFSSKALASSSLLLIFLLFSFSEAREILVGGRTDGWAIPSSQSESLNKWAESHRFSVGDVLVWKYKSGEDSVLRVTKEDYTSCNTSDPIEQYKDGETKLKLDQPGPLYFISGTKGHCEKGQKLVLVVMSPRKHLGISPAPSPTEIDAPAVAPTSSATTLQGGLVVMALGFLAMGLF